MGTPWLCEWSPIHSNSSEQELSARGELSTSHEPTTSPISSVAGSDYRQKIPLPKILGGVEENQRELGRAGSLC